MIGGVQAGDLFLICSDGLTGYAAEERIGAIMMDGRLGLEARADRLIDEALKAGGGDNVSVVLAKVTESGGEGDWEPENANETTRPEEFTGNERTNLDEGASETHSQETRRRSGTLTLLGILAFAVIILVVALAVHSRGGKVDPRSAPRPVRGARLGAIPKTIMVTAFDQRHALGAWPAVRDAQWDCNNIWGHWLESGLKTGLNKYNSSILLHLTKDWAERESLLPWPGCAL